MLHLTILVPAHNVAGYIQECLTSLLDRKNEHADFDIVVVDDGSTDRTYEIVESFLPNNPISLISLPKHTNVTDATAVGLQFCKGPVVTVVDGDDKVLPGAFTVVEEFEKDPSLGFAWTRTQLSTGQPGWSRPLPANKTLYEAMMLGWWNSQHEKFFRLSTYKQTVGLNTEFDRASDYQLVLLLASTGCKVKFVDRVTYWYRVGRPGSLTSQGSDKQRACAQGIRQWIQKVKQCSTNSTPQS